MANGKHSKLRTLNRINTTLKRKIRYATEKGIEKGINQERNFVYNLSWYEKIKFLFFKKEGVK